jgi:hypothetical protein
MAPLEIRHRSVRPISAKHAQASRFLQQSRLDHGFAATHGNRRNDEAAQLADGRTRAFFAEQLA